MRSENNDDIVKHEPEFSELWKSPGEMTSISSMCSLGTLGTPHQYQSLRGKAVGEPNARNLEVLWHPLYLGLLGNIGNTIASQKTRVQLYSPKPPEITVHRRGEIIRLRGRRLLHTRWLYFLKAIFETVLERQVVDVRKARAQYAKHPREDMTSLLRNIISTTACPFALPYRKDSASTTGIQDPHLEGKESSRSK